MPLALAGLRGVTSYCWRQAPRRPLRAAATSARSASTKAFAFLLLERTGAERHRPIACEPSGRAQPITHPLRTVRCGFTPPRVRHPTPKPSDLRARVPARLRVAERRLPAHGPLLGSERCWSSSGTSRGCNSLRTLPYLQRLARALRGRRACSVIGVHSPGYSFGRDRETVAARGRAARGPVPRGARPRPRGVAAVRQPGLAGALPVRPARPAALPPLRRGRVRGDRAARSRRAARASTRLELPDRSSRCARRTRRACCWSRRPRTSRCRRTATGSSWCATGPTARTGSRPPTPAPRRSFSYRAGGAYAVLSGGGVEPGLYETDGTVDGGGARAPAARLAVHARAASAVRISFGSMKRTSSWTTSNSATSVGAARAEEVDQPLHELLGRARAGA